MDVVISLVAPWVIKQVADSAATVVRPGIRQFLFGSDLENALVAPTSDALRVAVRECLGDKATEKSVQRAFEVLTMVWIDDLDLRGDEYRLTDRLHAVVARGIAEAKAPIIGSARGFKPASTLTALSDELGIVIDGDTLASRFVDAWVRAVRDAAIQKPILASLSAQLTAERLEEAVDRNRDELERLGEVMATASQSAVEEARREALWRSRERWFRNHVEPIDQKMQAIYDDYVAGFSRAAQEFRERGNLAEATAILLRLRRRRLRSRITVRTLTELLSSEETKNPFDDGVRMKFRELLLAVNAFLFKSDDRLYETWYSSYIEEFQLLLNRGGDPLDRHAYTDIAGPEDLVAPVARELDAVATVEIPERWRTYQHHYGCLRLACLP